MSVDPSVYTYCTASSPILENTDNELIDGSTLLNYVTTPASFIVTVGISHRDNNNVDLPTGLTFSVGTSADHDAFLPASAGITSNMLNTRSYLHNIPNNKLISLTSADNVYLYVNGDIVEESSSVYVVLCWVQYFSF
jgi:hypothetical protein